jgi:hypothetical protein
MPCTPGPWTSTFCMMYGGARFDMVGQFGSVTSLPERPARDSETHRHLQLRELCPSQPPAQLAESASACCKTVCTALSCRSGG